MSRLQRLASLQTTTTANMDVTQVIEWQAVGDRPVTIQQLTMTVSADCWIVINGNSRVRVLAQHGFASDSLRIRSLVVENAGIQIFLTAGA